MSPKGFPRRPKGNPGGRTDSRSGPRGARRCPRPRFGGPFGLVRNPREPPKRSSRFNESSIFAFHPTTVPGRPGSAPDPIIPIANRSGRSPLGYPLDLRRGYGYPRSPLGYPLDPRRGYGYPCQSPRTPHPGGRRIPMACGHLPPTPKENRPYANAKVPARGSFLVVNPPWRLDG